MTTSASVEELAAGDEAAEGSATLRRLAYLLGGLGLLACAAAVTLLVLNWPAIHSIDDADITDVTVPVGYAAIGLLLATRRPRNRVGWIFLGIGLTGGLTGLATEYTFRSWHFHRLPFVVWAAWSVEWLNWLVFPAGLATFFFLLFPDGRLQSSRWRWVARAAVVLVVLGAVFSMFQTSFQPQGSPRMDNPIGISALGNTDTGVIGLIWLPAFIVLLASMVGAVLRTRRSSGEARRQLQLLALATALIAVGLVAVVVASSIDNELSSAWWDGLIIGGFGVAVPVACGVAILKHGLYEIDVVMSKTVVYGLLAAFFTVVYVAVVVGIGTAVGSTHNPFLTIAAAAVIALAFNPVRDRAKRLANRIVYGKRATPYEVLSEFADRMGGTYSLEDVLPRMATILGEGTGARRATVWLRVGQELRPEASWGAAEGVQRPLPLDNGMLPAIAGASRVVAVSDRGDLLGALEVRKPPSEPLTAAESTLVADLAAQAGLVLRNVRLTEELRDNLDELRASRQRIVAAQDQARRRLERDIHDGAQQQLVALAVKARLADSMVGRDEARAHEMLSQIQAEAREALESLRELARGIYPPLLADQGLGPALLAQARKAAIPVAVEAAGLARYGEAHEAAVYFSVLEGLQNVAKYAGATHAVVRLGQSDGMLWFEVSDDGRGFDPGRTTYGTGLQGIADRLAALDGTLDVRSTPGRGTTVRGSIPVAGLPTSVRS
jgi:signal transduction histidine kinase